MDEEFAFNKSQIRSLNLFCLAFIIYSTFFAFSDMGGKIFQLLQIISIGFMIIASFKLIRFKIENEYLQIFYLLYCCWLLIVLLKGAGLLSNKDYLIYFLVNPIYGGMLYFVPLILLFPNKLFFYKKIFDVIFILGISYIIYDILFIRDLISSDQSSLQSQGVVEASADLSFPCGFLLLTYVYQTNKRKLLSIGVIFLTLLFGIIRARRGLILMTSGVIFFSAIQYLLSSKRKFLFIYLSMLLFCIGAIYASQLYKPKENRIFGFLLERGEEDTRTIVELYFYADMKTTDWIVGKGIDGSYYCPIIAQDAVTDYRAVIETGYLQIILKSGIISLALLLLVTVPAIFMGIFNSKNTLSKAAGIWILLSLISLYPATVNTFTLRYLLVWISVGICYSKQIRNIPEDFIKEFFQNRKLKPIEYNNYES